MSSTASQITSHRIVCSSVYSGADQMKHQRAASLAFVRGIHRWPVNSPHKGPVTRKMFPFDDVTMACSGWHLPPLVWGGIKSTCYPKKASQLCWNIYMSIGSVVVEITIRKQYISISHAIVLWWPVSISTTQSPLKRLNRPIVST